MLRFPFLNRQSRLFVLALASLWLPVIYLLSPQWTIYEQYAYGWAVPLLCLFLVWQRRQNSALVVAHRSPRPSDGSGMKGEGSPEPDQTSAHGSRPSALPRNPAPLTHHSQIQLFCALGALLLLLLPIRILQEANPFWRLASYGLAFEVIAITLLLVFSAGGSVSARHFAFPICFFLVAVPWPTPIEVFLVQHLTRFNTVAVTEVMQGIGIAALAHGNVIEVSTGMLGVEEACSGIRSFQAVLMLALFFGELHRLATCRRIALLAAGLATAMVLNIVRTSLLVFMAARHGLDFSNRWHDTTGVVVLVACFGTVWAIGRVFRHRTEDRNTVGPVAQFTMSGVPRPLLWGVIVGSACSVVGSELWFRLHERGRAAAEQWTISLPRERVGYHDNEISPGVKAALQFDTGRSAAWQNEDGTQWQLFLFRWNPASTLKDRVRVHLAKSHRPEACLPASGRTLERQLPPTRVTIDGIELPFRTYVFKDSSGPLFVFFCVREDGTPSGGAANMRETHAARWRAAWAGNRGLGQRSIEIAIFGSPGLAAAEDSLRAELPKFIHIQGPPL